MDEKTRPLPLTCRRDLERAERKARGGDEEAETTETVMVTALDLEDAWKKSAEG